MGKVPQSLRHRVAVLTCPFRGLRCRCFVLSDLAPLAWSHPQYKASTGSPTTSPEWAAREKRQRAPEGKKFVGLIGEARREEVRARSPGQKNPRPARFSAEGREKQQQSKARSFPITDVVGILSRKATVLLKLLRKKCRKNLSPPSPTPTTTMRAFTPCERAKGVVLVCEKIV